MAQVKMTDYAAKQLNLQYLTQVSYLSSVHILKLINYCRWNYCNILLARIDAYVWCSSLSLVLNACLLKQQFKTKNVIIILTNFHTFLIKSYFYIISGSKIS